jgi:CubicO group peptidase (beta-lactamase class C family)
MTGFLKTGLLKNGLLGAAAMIALAACQNAPAAPPPPPLMVAPPPPPLPPPHHRPHGMSAEKLGQLKGVMQGLVDRGEIAGAVVEIRQDGKDVFSEAFGWRDKEAKDPMKEDTIFRIASQTKALTSVGIMMLVEEGKLLLEDPVGKHLPEWKSTTVAVKKAKGDGYDVAPAKRPITIRDLMTHTAGISYGTGPGEKAWRDANIYGWYFADRTEPVSAVVARMAKLPMAAQPGEAFVYGYNTDILGVVIEKVSGQTLEQFLNERLIQPLGMTDTSFYLPQEKAGRLAVVYSADPAGVKRAGDPGAWEGQGHIGQGHYLNGPRVAFSGGAGLLSTAADYTKFLQMLADGGEAGGRRYIGRKSIELMTANHLGEIPYPAGTGFGLGFRIRTDLGENGLPGSEGEFSWGGAYHSSYWIDPEEGLTVSYMINLIPAGTVDDVGKLRSVIYGAVE